MVSLANKSESGREAQLQATLNMIPAYTWYADPSGALTFVNKRHADYLGLPQDHPLRFGVDVGAEWDSHLPLLHPDDHAEMRRAWSHCLRTGCAGEVSFRARNAEGGYRWFLSRVEPLRASDGTLLYWIGVTLDIDDAKRAQEALQESQFYLVEGQRLARMGSWAFNATGFSYWSPELFRIYGLDPAGKPPTVEEYLSLVHPEDRGFMRQGIAKMLDNHLAFDFTKRIVRPDGEIRHVRCVGVPVTQGGIFQGFLGTGMDVTEQERLTEELRLSEHYLSEGQRLAHMGSWAFNPSGFFSHWSRELLRVYGLDPAQQAPNLEQYLALIHPQDREFMSTLIKKMVAEALGCDVTKRIVRPDGDLRYIRCVGAPVVEDGALQRIVGTAMDVTEHELLTRELRRRQAYLEEAQRLSHTGSFGWKPDSGEIVWSEETYRIFEYDQAMKPTIDLLVQRVHPEDRADFLKVIESASAGAIQFEHTYRWLLPDGSVKHVHALAHALQDASGNREFVGAATDVTSIKRAEEELRKSEAYLAEAQRLSHTGSWAWSPDTDVRYWSEECYRVLGFDPRDGLPRMEELIRRIHPDDQPAFRESAKRARHNKLDEEVNYRIVHPGGAVRDIHSIGHPVFSPCGDLLEYTGTVIDVTERKRAEEELRRSEMELRQILDLVPQLVAVFGPGGERLYANRIGLDYVGLSLEEWRQTPGTFFQSGFFFHPDDRERSARTASGSVSSGGSASEFESRLRKRDGTYRWFLVRFNPLRDEQGQVTRWYVALTDIEDRKQAEEKLQQENEALREEIDQTSMFEEIVGTSRALRTVLSRISKVAPSDSTVLITGETGTGKELVARAIHRRSQRSGRAFVSVNCAAIPRDLILSELFGHEKGAFTGAMQRRLGRFEMADGGTIFLDEVGELSPDTQIALLRVLQEREFERVGGGQPIHVDVRVIAATNRDLPAAVADGTFRQDLFYRLNVFPIEVPPLRERKDDILMLVEYFAQRYATRAGKHVRLIDKKTLELLQSYAWPGNIRELQNVIERSVILSSGEVLSVDELLAFQKNLRAAPRVEAPVPLNDKVEPRSEQEIIEAALAETRGRVSGPSGAAARLKIPPSTLNNRIKSLKIDKKKFKFR
jgi:PAS domain S-box-containing protein